MHISLLKEEPKAG